jgi:hypothetical protein
MKRIYPKKREARGPGVSIQKEVCLNFSEGEWNVMTILVNIG